MNSSKTISYLAKLCLSLVLISFFQGSAFGQCAPPYQSLTYDTLVQGSGNTNFIFTIPQFDPNLGTLVAIDVHSTVTVNYGFTLANTDVIPFDFKIGIGRIDHFLSEELEAEYSNTMSANVGTYYLDPGDVVSLPQRTVISRYKHALKVSTNTAPFLGYRQLHFQYNPRTYTIHSGSSVYAYSAIATDTIHFSVTYSFCANIALATVLSDFLAEKKSEDQVGLSWKVANEQAGRSYELQEGSSVADFTTVGATASTANESTAAYALSFSVSQKQYQPLFFRLKITDRSGAMSYSDIKMVDMSLKSSGISLFPNPSDQFINVSIHQPGSYRWQVDILSATGGLLQTGQVDNGIPARIDFIRRLSAGVYFARMTDSGSGRHIVLPFLVR